MLQWLTGNIGFHHIHHLSPAFPNYNLERCQAAIPTFQSVPRLSIRRSLHALRLRLVDEARRRVVTLRELRRSMRQDSRVGPPVRS